MSDKWVNAFRIAGGTAGSEPWRLPLWWRASGYLAALAPFLFMAAIAWLRPDWNRGEIPDWRPVLASAGTALQRGDLYEARHLYLQAERLASWRGEWSGLVASACGFRRLGSTAGRYSKTFSILLRALSAAENARSRAGVAVIAQAFAALGESKAASMALARIRPEWLEETEPPGEALLAGCRAVP